MARLLAIATKPHRRADMVARDVAELTCEHGLAGDWRGKPGPRQVTLLSHAAWREACADLGMDLPWTFRRANLLVDDLPLEAATGKHLVLGEAVLEITGETDPCARMEEARQGLYQALRPHWRGGVTCRVIKNGILDIGMEVQLVTPG